MNIHHLVCENSPNITIISEFNLNIALITISNYNLFANFCYKNFIHMPMKKILLIIAHEGYQPIEYGATKDTLEAAGFKVFTASNELTPAKASPHENPKYSTSKIDVIINEINVTDYDGMFLIGGPGALDHLDNKIIYKLFKDFSKTNKPFGAICISPRILANAGLLSGHKATCWNGDNQVEKLFKENDVDFLDQDVVIDHKIVTANGPNAAENFAKAIISLF
jgi:protease I